MATRMGTFLDPARVGLPTNTRLVICLLFVLFTSTATLPTSESCEEDQWVCNDGTCIDIDKRCDFVIDCFDGGDEENCKQNEIVTETETDPAQINASEETQCHTNPCKHGGVCKLTDSADSGYVCLCPKEYKGFHCETPFDACETNANPCQNGGTCHEGNAFLMMYCTCPKGFLGRHCEVNVQDCVRGSCLNNGTCIDRVAGYECKCLPGFSGSRCENVDVSSYEEAFDNDSVQHLDPMVELKFNPKVLHKLLMRTAAAQGITPAKLQKELKELIAHHESGTPKSSKIAALEKKYNISDFPDSIDSNTTITYFRLEMMYPQLYRFYLTPIPNERAERKCPGLGRIPQIMRHPQFGGLIPMSLPDDTMALLVATHQYWLVCDSEITDPEVTFPAQIATRMGYSQLKDRLRFKILNEHYLLESKNSALNVDLSEMCLSASYCNEVYKYLKKKKVSIVLDGIQ